jgi:hypothetical protein
MSVFSKKHKVSVEDFSREFYDTNILGNTKIVDGFDHIASLVESYRDMLIEVDPAFSKTDSKLFHNLFAALRLEVFALAWMHKFGDITTFPQSKFTKEYLSDHHKSDIWDAMTPFNLATARSVLAGYKDDTPEGRARIGFIMTLRTGYADAIIKELEQNGIDPNTMDETDGRPINRLDSEPAWKSGMTPGYLMLTWGKGLNHKFNEEAQTKAIYMIRGFYDGSYESFDNITLMAN